MLHNHNITIHGAKNSKNHTISFSGKPVKKSENRVTPSNVSKFLAISNQRIDLNRLGVLTFVLWCDNVDKHVGQTLFTCIFIDAVKLMVSGVWITLCKAKVNKAICL